MIAYQRKTMEESYLRDVYASKLETKEEAIKQILDYHKLISSRPKQWEKPFFMD